MANLKKKTKTLVFASLLVHSFQSSADFSVYQRNYMDRVYPDTSVSTGLLTPLPDSTTPISVTASPGEFEPASIVLKADTSAANFDISISDLTSAAATIPAAATDIGIARYQKTNAPYGNVPANVIGVGNSWGVYFRAVNAAAPSRSLPASKIRSSSRRY